MKRLLIIASLMFVTPATAAPVTITLDDNERQQFIALLDLAVKQGGLNAARVAAYFQEKLQRAMPPVSVAPPAASTPDKPDTKLPEPKKP